MTSDLATDLEALLAATDVEALAALIAADADIPADEARRKLRTYLAESRTALRLLQPHLSPGARLLEVGSGIGFFSRFLFDAGYDIVELEPVGQGFDFMGAARRTLAREPAPPLLDHGVEALDADRHGPFDIIYSLNVFEHVDDWRLALDSAAATLAPGGKLIVSCPNYLVPYEPHFGVPLVPVKPALTERLLPDRITESGLWRSLNWIDLRAVRDWADDRDATVAFERGQLARIVGRLNDDAEFRKRHGSLLRGTAKVLRTTRVERALGALPPAAVTPMEFVVTTA